MFNENWKTRHLLRTEAERCWFLGKCDEQILRKKQNLFYNFALYGSKNESESQACVTVHLVTLLHASVNRIKTGTALDGFLPKRPRQMPRRLLRSISNTRLLPWSVWILFVTGGAKRERKQRGYERQKKKEKVRLEENSWRWQYGVSKKKEIAN